MKEFTCIFLLLFGLISCQSQKTHNENGHVGGPCEGCDAIFEYGDMSLMATHILPAFMENNPKVKISGVVFEKDGKTPAKDVILYIYHTNRQGIYETKGDEKGWAKRHGYIRGWIKTGADGAYTFYTFRPVAYPNSEEPEHIHITVKEPDKNEYYIDEIVFADDPFLTFSKRKAVKNRGGSGIVIPKVDGEIMAVERNIILGLNIPDYY